MSTTVGADPVDPAGPVSDEVPTRRLLRVPVLDVALAGLAAALTFVVHNVGYVLSAPYWVDECWVAVSTRLPLSQASQATAVTPLGWTVLLRAVFAGGDQRQRLVPLLFSALTVVAAYAVGRALPWRAAALPTICGALAAVAVLMAPSSLLRNDLKQYTTDAFVTVLIIFMVARVERQASRRALAALAVTGAVSFLFSTVALFATVAAFTALFVAALAARRWRALVEISVAGAGVGVVSGLIFLVVYRPHILPNLTSYWQAYYLPVGRGLSASLHYLHVRGTAMATYLGMGPLLLAIALVLAGIVTLFRLNRPALALLLPVLLAETAVLSAAKKYPLFDQRTSHFLTVAFALYAAVGVAGVCALLARRTTIAAGLVAAAVATVFVIHVDGYVRSRSIPLEDVRTPVAYLVANGRPDDVIIVNSSANWGFGYYWPEDEPSITKSSTVATGFAVVYPDQERIDIATDRTPAAVTAAVARAKALIARRPGARIWLVRMHVSAGETVAWRTALSREPSLFGHGERAVGCGLILYTPGAGSTANPSC